MAVTIEYLSGGLFVVQIQAEVPEDAALQVSPAFLKPARLLNAWGVMTGAGAGSDTVQLKRNTTALSDAVDVSAKGDKAYFNFGTLDDAQMDFGNGDTLLLDTVSDANAIITALFAERQATP
jgi:hypothetical protein